MSNTAFVKFTHYKRGPFQVREDDIAFIMPHDNGAGSKTRLLVCNNTNEFFDFDVTEDFEEEVLFRITRCKFLGIEGNQYLNRGLVTLIRSAGSNTQVYLKGSNDPFGISKPYEDVLLDLDIFT